MELADQLPVAELDDVRVAIDPTTTGGYTLDRRDGLVSWRKRLRPGERQTTHLAFHVVVPARYE